MKITVFAKKKTTREGKPFTAYVARLKRKDGSELSASIKFREECGAPNMAECPLNIIVPKESANLSDRVYIREDTGEEAISYTLWVSAWERDPEMYVDHSLDDFE